MHFRNWIFTTWYPAVARSSKSFMSSSFGSTSMSGVARSRFSILVTNGYYVIFACREYCDRISYFGSAPASSSKSTMDNARSGSSRYWTALCNGVSFCILFCIFTLISSRLTRISMQFKAPYFALQWNKSCMVETKSKYQILRYLRIMQSGVTNTVSKVDVQLVPLCH